MMGRRRMRKDFNSCPQVVAPRVGKALTPVFRTLDKTIDRFPVTQSRALLGSVSSVLRLILIAFMVLFVVGPITSLVLWLAWKRRV